MRDIVAKPIRAAARLAIAHCAINSRGCAIVIVTHDSPGRHVRYSEHLEPDLNDGVVFNIAPLHEVERSRSLVRCPKRHDVETADCDTAGPLRLWRPFRA
jgi:hypothetical protein